MTADRPATEPRPHRTQWIDAGRDEPPENGYWRCQCGVTFAPDGVESGIAHGWAEAAQGAVPRAEGLPSEAEDWYELDRRILASEQRIVLLEAVIREAVAHIEGFMANGPQQPAGGWYGAQSWLAELPSRLRPSDERQPGDSDDR